MTLVRLRIDLTTFTKILTWQSIGHMQSFRTFAIPIVALIFPPPTVAGYGGEDGVRPQEEQ